MKVAFSHLKRLLLFFLLFLFPEFFFLKKSFFPQSLQKMIREFKDHFFLKEVNKEGQPFFKIIASSETLKNLIETSGK